MKLEKYSISFYFAFYHTLNTCRPTFELSASRSLLLLVFFIGLGHPGKAQQAVDFYFGPNLSVLNQIPDHFKQVSADYQKRYNTSQEYLLRQHSLGSMWGLRLNFVSSNFSLPLSLEYNRIRKISRSNAVDFPDKGYTGQYRMKFTSSSVGFVFGNCDAPIRIGTYFDFGQIFWKKKYYPSSEFREGKWVPYTETIDFGVIGMARGPVFTGLNVSIIGRWKYVEARAYYLLAGRVNYPDYTNNLKYPVNPSHVGFSLCFVPTRTGKD